MTANDKPTLDCTDIQAMLSALVDGELDADRRHGAERHLAGCEACRTLLSEAEGLELLVAAAVGHEDRPATLPPGFEDAVLRRIAGEPARAPHSWRGWLGWVTAAAAILLLGLVWWLDGSSAPPVGPAPGAPPARSAWIHPVVNEVAQYPASVPARAAQQALASDAASPGTISTLTRNDAEALDGASLLLTLLRKMDDGDFATVDRVRAVVEYDELLPRLAAARADLPVENRAVMLAAESILYRVVRGPLSEADVREIRQAIVRLGLDERIESLSGLWSNGASL
jgi:hypothetical protein